MTGLYLCFDQRLFEMLNTLCCFKRLIEMSTVLALLRRSSIFRFGSCRQDISPLIIKEIWKIYHGLQTCFSEISSKLSKLRAGNKYKTTYATEEAGTISNATPFEFTFRSISHSHTEQSSSLDSKGSAKAGDL